MRILVLGATGFIGKAIFLRLVDAHEVVVGSRKCLETYPYWRKVDFFESNDWGELVRDIDLVINAIGIISGDFTQVQTKAPKELFSYCLSHEIKVINISAIGAERSDPPNIFLQSKKEVDTFLLKSNLAKVIYPGIVLGKDGKSSQFFKAISEFPIVPLIGGDPPLVHINQLAELVSKIVNDFASFPAQVFAIASAEKMTSLYTALRGTKAIYVTTPSWPVKILFTLFPRLEIGLFNKNMATMIDEIDVKDYQPIFDQKATSFIHPNDVRSSDVFLRMFGLIALFVVWIWSGVSSLVSWSTSEELMASIGIGKESAAPFIYAGGIVDIILGVGLLFKRTRRISLLAQIGFIVVYTLILSFFAPEFWMHPFGVLTKNLPLLFLGWWLLRKK